MGVRLRRSVSGNTRTLRNVSLSTGMRWTVLPILPLNQAKRGYMFNPGGGVACSVDVGKKFDTETNCLPLVFVSTVR